MKQARRISLWLLAALFIAAGVNHFVNTNFYLNITPPYIPATAALIAVSGFFEIAGGLGLLLTRLRRWAGWGLIALLIAVSPVHVHMLLHSADFPSVPYWALVARMLLQLVLIAWVYGTACRREGWRSSC